MRMFFESYGHNSGRWWAERTDAEIKAAWHTVGQGHEEAKARGRWCVVVECDEEEAIHLSRLFIREFAIPTCCHYDGTTLSMECGGAGGHGVADLMARMRSIVPSKEPPK